MALSLIPLSRGLTDALEASALELQDAQASYAGAVVAHAEAKRALELARARLLCEGVDGKNAEAREAAMRLTLEHEHDALFQAEVALTEARCQLDCARIEWDTAR
ncbi:MAG: hypothetical protein M3511_13675, partial [Deinococcota bacterium]|nr:hypothetical protein [Deinococcota bacterium]